MALRLLACLLVVCAAKTGEVQAIKAEARDRDPGCKSHDNLGCNNLVGLCCPHEDGTYLACCGASPGPSPPSPTPSPGCPPPQFVYDESSATSTVHEEGCTITSWDGMDSDGMSGPPWVSYVNCSAGASYKARGVSIHGDFQIWLHHGQLSLNGQVLSHMGEGFWIAPGTFADLEVAGAAYVAGAKFELSSPAETLTRTSSFVGPKFRRYAHADALANRGHSTIIHDPHICNGSSPSKDIVWGSQTGVDPVGVNVVNCAPASTPDKNFVWSHFHPFGALYMPLSGEICFATDDVVCVRPGSARWTSPNLQYYEFFRKINVTNPEADTVRDFVGVPGYSTCQYPIVFAVTNFDGFSVPAGVPNFQDWPVNAHGTTSAAGIGPWGIFPKMTVQATKVIVKVSSVMLESGADETHEAPLSLLV